MKRFYVEWIDEAGDLETTPLFAASPGEALDAVARSLRPHERIGRVDPEWDAVMVDGGPILRAEWEARTGAKAA